RSPSSPQVSRKRIRRARTQGNRSYRAPGKRDGKSTSLRLLSNNSFPMWFTRFSRMCETFSRKCARTTSMFRRSCAAKHKKLKEGNGALTKGETVSLGARFRFSLLPHGRKKKEGCL